MLLGLLSITFAISYVAPGDPARLAAGPKPPPRDGPPNHRIQPTACGRG